MGSTRCLEWRSAATVLALSSGDGQPWSLGKADLDGVRVTDARHDELVAIVLESELTDKGCLVSGIIVEQ